MRAGGFPGNPGGLVVSIVKTAGGRAPAHHARGGVGARMRAGLRASHRRARHLPMRYETGLPSSVIRFRT